MSESALPACVGDGGSTPSLFLFGTDYARSPSLLLSPAANGVHHWLNRISSALARLSGLSVIDLTDHTLAHRPLDHAADGVGWMTSRPVDALEGDVYHGYRANDLGPLFLRALVEACCPAGGALPK